MSIDDPSHRSAAATPIAQSAPVEADAGSSPLLTVRQAALVLGCSIANVYALIAAGELPVIAVGRSRGYRLAPAQIEEFLRRRTTIAGGSEAPRPRLSRSRLKHLKL